MTNLDDWRLTNQIDYLYQKQLKYINFRKSSDRWDHEHCEFCNKAILEDSIKEYCTLDEYYWICEDCYKDFNDLFEWKIVEA